MRLASISLRFLPDHLTAFLVMRNNQKFRPRSLISRRFPERNRVTRLERFMEQECVRAVLRAGLRAANEMPDREFVKTSLIRAMDGIDDFTLRQ